jgi:hypothetical protein
MFYLHGPNRSVMLWMVLWSGHPRTRTAPGFGETGGGGMKVLIVTLIIVEAYYWFIYLPRAWKSGENREIENIKRYFKMIE